MLSVVCLAVLAVVAGLEWSEQLLTIEQPPENADIMVVLGGEWVYRPKHALELYNLQLAPNIIVTGQGDAGAIKRWLAARGLPPSAIQVEGKSLNTMQNAELTVPLLRERNARRVVLVTSWFHSRRALACFRKAAPEIAFVSLPTVEDRPKGRWPNRYERRMVLQEYVKLAGYWIRYGVWPFAGG
jgi:uncharacterized SAM-binding protein YcdF (DUF218 family)